MEKSEEVDYMSPAFLEQIEKESSSKKGKRKQIDPPQILSRQKLMSQQLSQGLNNPITSTNKGFQLLSKFGYSGDGGLGKSNIGISAPIDVISRESNDKSGIGKFEVSITQEKSSKEQRKIREISREQMEAQFLTRNSSSTNKFQLSRNIRKAQQIIFELDSRADINPHNLWPESELADLGIDGSRNIDDDSETQTVTSSTSTTSNNSFLFSLLSYLRFNHSYCLYCVHQYDNLEELEKECPGVGEEEHE